MGYKSLLARFRNVLSPRKRRLYFDHASAPIPLSEFALARNAAEHLFGNPSAVHEEGRAAKKILEEARGDIARVLAVKHDEIVFTSGGTESNNLAILGFARAEKRVRGSLEDVQFITTTIEHPSVLLCFKELENEGAYVTYVRPDSQGRIHPEALTSVVCKKRVFVSIGYINGEIGVEQDIRSLSRALREHMHTLGEGIAVFHTDASQAPLYFDCTIHTLGVDLATFDAMKMRGPKGIGFLVKGHTVRLKPILLGGGQEMELRAGTEHVGAAHACALALKRAVSLRKERYAHVLEIWEYAQKKLTKAIPGIVINGNMKHHSPSILNISIPGIDAEYCVVILDTIGIASGTRSACLPFDGGGSSVVREISGDQERAESALRFSFGEDVTSNDIDQLISGLRRALPKARKFDRSI